MRIAQVVSTFPPYKGGIGNTAYNYALFLKKLNTDITTFFPANDEQSDFTDELKLELCKPLISKGNAAFIPGIYNKVAGYDLIFFHYPFIGGTEAIILRKLLNPKQKLVVYYHHDLMPPKDLFRKFVFNIYNLFLAPILLRLADKVIVSTFDFAQNSKIGNYYKKNKFKFEAIAFGVNREIFKKINLGEENQTVEKVKQKIDWKKDDKVIVYVGNISTTHYYKGIKYLIEAANLLIKKNHQIKLCLVGRGDLIIHYQKIVDKLDISGNVKILDDINDQQLNIINNLSLVNVSPSINMGEAFGIVLIEAMAVGTPVIASDLPGVRKVFEDQVSGFICQPKDIVGLAQKIELIINDVELQQKMSLAALTKSQEYDWLKLSDKLKNVFNNL